MTVSTDLPKWRLVLALAALFLSSMCTMGDLVISPIVSNIYQVFGNQSEFLVNLGITGPAIVGLPFGLAAGFLCDRMDKKIVMVVGFLIFTVSSVFGITFQNLYWFVIMRQLATGVGWGITNTAALSILADLFTDKGEHGKYVGWYNAAMSIIGALLALTAGQLAVSGWQNAYLTYLAAIPVLIMLIVFLPSFPPVAANAGEVEEAEPELAVADGEAAGAGAAPSSGTAMLVAEGAETGTEAEAAGATGAKADAAIVAAPSADANADAPSADAAIAAAPSAGAAIAAAPSADANASAGVGAPTERAAAAAATNAASNANSKTQAGWWRNLVPLSAQVLAVACCYYVILYMISIYVVDSGAGDEAFTGMLTSVMTISSAIGSFIFGAAYERFRTAVYLPSLFVIGAVFFVLAFVPIAPVIVVTLALAGFAWPFFFCYFYSHATAVSPANKAGTATSIVAAANGVAVTASSYLLMASIAATGGTSLTVYPYFGAFMLVVAVISAVATALSRRR